MASPSSTSGLGQAGAYSLGWSPKSRFAPFDEEPSQAAQWLAGGHLHVLRMMFKSGQQLAVLKTPKRTEYGHIDGVQSTMYTQHRRTR